MALKLKSGTVSKGKRLSEQVYDLLERQIVKGGMPPGTHLAEERIARELGVSRSPVRQAIATLQQRGLAEWADGRDRRVSIPSVKFAADVFDTCMVLECGRVCQSSREATDEDHSELKDCLSRMAKARSRGRMADYQKAAAAFRAVLVRRCDNEKLNQLSQELDTYRQWIVSTVYPSTASMLESDEEHREIIEAYIARDMPRLMMALETHAKRTRAAVLTAFTPTKEGGAA